MVDRVRPRQNELGHGDESVAVLDEGLQDGGQGFGGVQQTIFDGWNEGWVAFCIFRYCVV